jgi:hypothetical protein
MAGYIKITPVGLEKVLNGLRSLPAEIKKEIDHELEASAAEVKELAVRNLRSQKAIDESRLWQSINDNKVGNNYEVSVGANYGPFVEFGTKRRAKPTRGFESYAQQFKGRTVSGPQGSLDEAILGWVKRKKIRFEKAAYADTNYKTGRKRKVKSMKQRYLTPEQTAFIIARHISFHGIKPHPFLFPAFVQVRRNLVPKMISAIRRAFRK